MGEPRAQAAYGAARLAYELEVPYVSCVNALLDHRAPVPRSAQRRPERLGHLGADTLEGES